jgi:hypothetical protein
MLETGILNLTNWLGNLIMPTLAGLFFAGAIYSFSRGLHWQRYSHAGFAALMCSGILRLLESFSQAGAWDDPNRFWLATLALVSWVGNVALPLYGVVQVVLMVLHFAGLLERLTIGEVWVRNLIGAVCAFSLSGILRLAETWIQKATAIP